MEISKLQLKEMHSFPPWREHILKRPIQIGITWPPIDVKSP